MERPVDITRSTSTYTPPMRFRITTSFELPGAHRLNLPYDSKCQNLHGHTYRFTVELTADQLSHDMVLDFTHLKHVVLDEFLQHHDHIMWNDKLEQAFHAGWFDGGSNPTSEVIAQYTFGYLNRALNLFLHTTNLGNLYAKAGVTLQSVTVWESPSNSATYERLS